MKRKAIPLASKFGIFASLWWLPGFLSGQQSAGVIHPPTLGFVFDSGTHTLKPILGIPGAAMLGAPLATGSELADAAVSPRQDYALFLTGDAREVKLLQLATSGAPASSIEGLMAAPDLMALSPTGTAAALYRANDGLLQVVSGLPDSPQILREIACASLGGALTSAAVADDGQTVLAAVDNHIFLVPADGIPRPLPLDGPISAMAFRPRTQDVIIAARNNQILLISHVADMPEIQLLAGPDDGIADPLAVAFSLDGRRAWIADSGGNLVQFDLSGAPPQSLSCQCTITGLHRLAGSSVFRLTDPPDGPLMIFDGDAAQPRILFVPAPAAGGANGTQ